MYQRIWRRLRPRRRHLKADLTAGVIGGIAAIPDGMAAAVMAGVNPIHGIYASMVGRITGGLLTSSVFMCVTTTGAISITIADAMASIPQEQQAGALALLVLLAGIVQLGMGLLRLGFLIRFVSNTVTTGFLTGVAVAIVLSQLGDLFGYRSDAGHQLIRLYDLVAHIDQIHWPTTLVGGITIATVVALNRTRFASLAMLIALVLAGGVTHLLGLDDVLLVGDDFEIPRVLPLPILPDLSFIPQVTLTAVSVAIIGLLQAGGLSQSQPNPDGQYPSVSRDFAGQGVANIACGLLRGLPVGGSIGQTHLLVSAGSRSRWATIFSGATVAIAILLIARLVEALPMAALAGLLVVVGVRAVNVEQVQVIWRSGNINAAVMGLTFVLTLVLPMEQAVVLGVLVTFVLQIFRAANRLQLLELHLRPDGLFEERSPSSRLPSREITVLYPNGSLFFAGAQVFESKLPDPNDADKPVVILVLRGRKEVGSTFIGVVDRYARKLQARGGKLMLVGVSPRVFDQLWRTRLLRSLEPHNVYSATSVVGQAGRQAHADATAWLAAQAAAERKRQDSE